MSSIDDELLVKIQFWCNALLCYTSNSKDQKILKELCSKAANNKYMSPVIISNEIEKTIEIYHLYKLNRDDILNGLEEILKATGKKFEV